MVVSCCELKPITMWLLEFELSTSEQSVLLTTEPPLQPGQILLLMLLIPGISENIRIITTLFCTSLYLPAFSYLSGKEKQTLSLCLDGSYDSNGFNQTLEGHLSLYTCLKYIYLSSLKSGFTAYIKAIGTINYYSNDIP